MEDLSPADVRVLLQAEEELSQVPLMSKLFSTNNVDLRICKSKFMPNMIPTSLSSVNSGRESFPPPTPLLTIFYCQILGELKTPLSRNCFPFGLQPPISWELVSYIVHWIGRAPLILYTSTIFQIKYNSLNTGYNSIQISFLQG